MGHRIRNTCGCISQRLTKNDFHFVANIISGIFKQFYIPKVSNKCRWQYGVGVSMLVGEPHCCGFETWNGEFFLGIFFDSRILNLKLFYFLKKLTVSLDSTLYVRSSKKWWDTCRFNNLMLRQTWSVKNYSEL